MSWQAMLFNRASRHIVKPFIKRKALSNKSGEEGLTIESLREWADLLDKFLTFGAADTTTVDEVEDKPGYLWVNNKPGVTRTILYLHGGGMIIHVPGLYKQWAQRLGLAANARVLLIDYRLAPEHPFPGPNDDCFAAYRWLVRDQGFKPKDIVIAGDSAGGYLTLATLLRIGQSRIGKPSCAIALSPLADFSFGSESMFTNETADPLLSNRLIPLVRHLVLGEHPCSDPQVSPVYADLSKFPPLQIHVSAEEILRDDGVRIVERAQEHGVVSELCEWFGTTHVHPIFEWLPESKLAVNKMVRFMDSHCPT